MANTLQVEIVTPERAAYSGAASEVILPAWEGEMGIYPDHDALLALLRAGSCTVVGSEGVFRAVVGRGFVDVGPTRVTMLTDSCVPVDAIDKAKAGKDLAAAEHELAIAEAGSERQRQAQIAYEYARALLDA
jgi:F-type H+-transporting ATPase subunit epsilon